MTCHFILLADHNALGMLRMMGSHVTFLLIFEVGLGFFASHFLEVVDTTTLHLNQNFCRYRTSMEFSILLECVHLSKATHFSESLHASFLGRNFAESTWNFQWKQAALSLHNRLFVKAHTCLTWSVRDLKSSPWLQEDTTGGIKQNRRDWESVNQRKTIT